MPFRWQALVDFAFLAAAFYVVLRWANQARAVRIALAIIGLHVGALVARDYDLVITSWVLSGAGFLAIAVLLVVFQPELRHAFMRIDALLRSGWRPRSVLQPTYRAVADAAFELAQAWVGALIVFIRRDAIGELIQDGLPLGADVSRELIVAIFQKASPVHDGAMILNGKTIVRAKAVLPLSARGDVPPEYGTRHRAAMGLAERSDALIVAVSEQRGTVTLMRGRAAVRMGSRDELVAALEKLHAAPEPSLPGFVRSVATSNLRFKIAAIGLAAVVWGVALTSAGATVRTVQVPVVFTGVPAGMDLTAPSATEVEIQVRGNPWIMNSAALTKMTANFDLSGKRPGNVLFAVGANNLNLPPGVRVERATPRVVSVRLHPKGRP